MRRMTDILILFLVTVVIMVKCEIESSQRMEFGQCLMNHQSLRIYGISLVQCVNECRNRPNCVSLSYDRRLKRCEVYDNSILTPNQSCKGMIFSSRSDVQNDVTSCSPPCVDGKICVNSICTFKECGSIPEVNNEEYSVLGNMRKVGSKVLYKCIAGRYKPTGGTSVTSECQQDGTWSGSPPTCYERSIGMPCSESSQCWEENTICIDGKCFCTYLARYDTVTGTCNIGCEAYASSFQMYPGNAIGGYNLEVPLANSAEDCQQRCKNRAPECGSVDYNTDSKGCSLGKLTYQQVLDGDPSALRHGETTLNLYSRHC